MKIPWNLSSAHFLLSGVFLLPLTSPEGWHHLKFNRVPQNTVQFGPSGLSMSIAESSSPLVYTLKEPLRVIGFEATGHTSGLPRLPAGADESDSNADDFALRLGIAETGDDSLGFFARLFAPPWIRELLELNPTRHFSGIHFYLMAQKQAVGTIRKRHSRPITESVVAQVQNPGPFALNHQLSRPLSAFAIWVQADGDNTRSQFETNIKTIKLLTE